MRRLNPAFPSAFAFLFLSIFHASCQKTDPNDEVLRVHLSSDPVSLDPARIEDGVGLQVAAVTYWGLTQLTENGWIEGLARKVEVLDNHKRFRFLLRPDLKWSDGKPLTSIHFADGIRRALLPEVGSKLVHLLFPIKGAHDFYQKRSKIIVGLKTPSPTELEIELESSVPFFPQILALSVGRPFRDDVLSDPRGTWPSLGPTTGPYAFSQITRGERIELVRNTYFSLPWSGPRRLEFVTVSDESTALALFERKELDVLYRFPLTELSRLRTLGRVEVSPFLATYYLGFNLRHPLVQDRELRLAISKAIDKEGIVALLGAGEPPASAFIPPPLEGAELFRKGPLASGSKPPKKLHLSASYDQTSRNQFIMEKVQSDLKNNLGLSLKLKSQDWKTHVRSLASGSEPIYRFGWLAPFPDPITHLQVFVSNSPNNHSHWSNPEYDRLVAEIGTLPSGPQRKRLIQRAQQILVHEEAVIVPIYHYVQVVGFSERASSLSVLSNGTLKFGP